MKFTFSLKKREASVEADIEGIVEKSLDYKAKNPIKQTKYQIKQEEKRKAEELKHKHQLQYLYILLGMIVLFAIIGFVASLLGI